MVQQHTNNTQNKHAVASLDDNRFKQFLENADEIASIEHFKYWKDEFLATFRQYLDPMGTATARESDEELYLELERLAKLCVNTKTLIKEGKITPDFSSVKGQKTINEMISCMGTCETSIDKYFPKTKEEEAICGYSKFELAAVSVRDGFRVYGLMVLTRDTIRALISKGGGPKPNLDKVLKPNQMSIIQYYFRSLESFTQTMADLGMFKLMQKCEEIYKVRPRGKKKKTKMKKKQAFDRHGTKDALSDTSGDDDDSIHGKRMFQKSKQEFKAIMDDGWSNGFQKGQEIKAPPAATTSLSKKKKKTTTTKKNKLEKSATTTTTSTTPGTDGEPGEDGEGMNKDTTNDPAKVGKSSSPTVAARSLDDIDESDDKYNDDKSDDDDDKSDDDDDESSSEEEEEEDDDDKEVIYYFDPVRKIVGKVSRKKCLAENIIVTVDEGGTEQAEGVVEDWDTKDDGQMGKTELIWKLKEILRGESKEKV